MDQLQKMLQEAMAAVEWPAGMSQDEILNLVREKTRDGVELLSTEVYDALMTGASDMLAEERLRLGAFERRNRRRWKKPLDQLKTMVRIVEESAEGLCNEWGVAPDSNVNLFSALNRLCVKALVISREAICLMEGGFADGALARWRSLHEAAVTATFIAKYGETTAEKFIASFAFASKKAMLQMNEYAERAGMQEYSIQELEAAKNQCGKLEALLGKGLGDEYGWAREALGFDLKKRVVFFDIEKVVALDHWRPRYRWASQNVHSSFTPPRSSLGMAEAKEEVHLTGPSNSGMVDPLHMIAITLTIVTTAFFSKWPNIDRIVLLRVLSRMAAEVGPVAIGVEAESSRRAVGRKKAL